MDDVVDEVTPAVADNVQDLQASHGDELAALASRMTSCERSGGRTDDTSLLLPILRRAFVNAEWVDG